MNPHLSAEERQWLAAREAAARYFTAPAVLSAAATITAEQAQELKQWWKAWHAPMAADPNPFPRLRLWRFWP